MSETSRTKLQLGWGPDNPEEHWKQRRIVKAYALSKKITSRRDASNAEWKTFQAIAIRNGNAFLASGQAILQLADGDKETDKAHKRFNYLMLDAVKKDRETLVKEGLVAAGRKHKRVANTEYRGREAELQATGREQLQVVVVRVVIARAGVIDDYFEEDGSSYKWATAMREHLVKLQ